MYLCENLGSSFCHVFGNHIWLFNVTQGQKGQAEPKKKLPRNAVGQACSTQGPYAAWHSLHHGSPLPSTIMQLTLQLHLIDVIASWQYIQLWTTIFKEKAQEEQNLIKNLCRTPETSSRIAATDAETAWCVSVTKRVKYPSGFMFLLLFLNFF